MNEKNLVICDKEFRYAESLGENISGREDLSVKVYVCSDLENVLQLLQERSIHIFVVDERFSYEERCMVNANQVFVLGQGNLTVLGKNESSVYKYQCADEIIREIFETYMEKTNENLIRCLRKERAKLIAVYSPIHRVGKTTFAVALGKALAQKKHVLYLNMEEYSGFEISSEDRLNLGDLLYYMKQGNGALGIRLQAAVSKMGEMDYVLPIPVSRDLKETTAEEWEALLSEIVQSSAYERIILDVGECVQGLFEILELCDRVYMPVLKDDISEKKMQHYERNIERLQLSKLPHITYRFVMPENIEEYAKLRMKEEC